MNLKGKRVLVTGGTGSLGHALVRRILTGEMGLPAQLEVFSRDETKQHHMRIDYLHKVAATDDVIYRNSKDILRFTIGDVRDYPKLRAAVAKSDVIFHAAALKQVPSCEYFPEEAVMTNVIGPMNLVRAVRETENPSAVIGISTDKACKPVNVMGMTKALQERIILQGTMDAPDTRFNCVRYGNVVASRGSVVPLFAEQAVAGGPVTITTRDMTRFLLTLDQAVDTVFAAFSRGKSGETFIPRAPSALVTDIAKAVIGDRKIPLKVVGIRPGEKIHEIMVSEEECHRTMSGKDYHVIQPVLPELRHGKPGGRTLREEYSSRRTTLRVPQLQRLLAPYIDVQSGRGAMA